MRTILDQLNQDHGNVARLLDIFDEQVEHARHGNPLDVPLLQNIMRYLTQYQDVFHHPREDLLFGKLALRSAESTRDVEELEAEHVVLARRGSRLYRDLIRLSRRDAEQSEVQARMAEYSVILRQHMTRESSHVFPLAKIILVRDDWKSIDATLEVNADPLFGPAVETSYRIVLERIGARQ